MVAVHHMLLCAADTEDFSVCWVKSRRAETGRVTDESEGK